MTDSSKLRPDTVAVMFLQQFLQDRQAGTTRSLAEYQTMFPGDPGAIANEFEGLETPTDSEMPTSDRYLDAILIGHGGMGIVYQAVDPRLGRTIAIKHLSSGRSSDEPGDASPVNYAQHVARFLNEARITAQLQHPNIVPVLEVGDDGASRPFFTMPLIEGRTLANIVTGTRDGNGDWPLVRSLGVVVMVCDAVAYAHAKGIIHRDLKPSNIMVGRFGEAYVVDWGLARRESDSSNDGQGAPQPAPSATLTMAGDVVGTPAYMAPEQATGECPHGHKRGDVYSLGATLYQVLTGTPPYIDASKGTGGSTIERVKQGPPRAVLAIVPDCAAPLIAICEKAMARAPEHRYPSAIELAADLRALIENRVVQAYATGPLAELRTWVRRNRSLATTAILAVLLLIGGVIATTALKLDSDRNAEAAEESFELAFEAAENLLLKYGVLKTVNVQGTDLVRDAMAREALTYYQRLAAQRAGDPRVADKVALAHFRIARLQSRAGNATAATTSVAAAREAFAALQQVQQLQDVHRIAMVQLEVEANLVLMEQGQAKEAIAALPPLLESSQELLQRNPDSPELRHLLGTALHNMAMALTKAGDHEGALTHCDKKLVIVRQFVADFPKSVLAHEQLGSGLQLRGKILQHLGRPEDALVQYQQARAALEGSLKLFPSNRDLLSRTCQTRNNLAVVHDELGQPAEALEALKDAIQGQRLLVNAFPNVRDYLGNLAGSECNVGAILARQDKHDEAGPMLAQALQHIRQTLAVDATHRGFRNYRRIIGRELGNLYLAMRQHAKAAGSVRQLVAEQPGQHSWLAAVQLAACAAICQRSSELPAAEQTALIKQYGDEVMQHLQAANKAARIPPNQLRNPSFDTVRSRPEFRALQDQK